MDPLIKKYLEMQAGVSEGQDVEALRQAQEEANALKDETSRYGGLMTIAKGLSMNKDVEGPEKFIEQRLKLADQPVTDVKDRQKSELSVSDAVRQHLLGGIGANQREKGLQNEKVGQTISKMKALADLSHQKVMEEQGQQKIDNDLATEKAKLAEGKPPTAAQSSAALYAARLKQANDVMDSLEAAGYDRAATLERVNGVLPNEVVSKDRQSQNQAEDNFLNAVLRKESGASISPAERQSGERQYFPRPGDAKEVVDQKRQNRLLAMAGLEAEAGSALGKIQVPQPGSPVSNKLGKSGLTSEQRKARLAEIDRLLAEGK